MTPTSAISGRSFTTSSSQLVAYMHDDGLRGEQLVSAIEDLHETLISKIMQRAFRM